MRGSLAFPQRPQSLDKSEERWVDRRTGGPTGRWVLLGGQGRPALLLLMPGVCHTGGSSVPPNPPRNALSA